MRKTVEMMLLAFGLMVLTLSCNNEELFVEVIEEEIVLPDDDNNDDNEDEVTQVDPTTPCDFTLDDVQPNATIIINCLMDLEGQTINLPANVTIVYEGGDIINGTLNFSEGTIIGGELLNSTLTLSGANPQLKDPTFTFLPERWGIVEGVVSDEVALNNKNVLRTIINQLKELGVYTFQIDKINAYFKIDDNITNVHYQPAIEIPSNFKLLMSNQTHLRVQPYGHKLGALFVVSEKENVTIEGGNLYGDRDEHDYSDGGTHEWPVLIGLSSVKNTVVRNVTIQDATGDAMAVGSKQHAWASDYDPTDNLLITGCKLIRSRRNNLSITDGRNIYVENNEFIDAGVHTSKSNGTAPGFAIDVEAVRGSHPSGPYEIAEDIFIRNNVEKGSRVGGFTVHTGDRVTIEENQMENGISYSTSIGTVIRNNVLIAKSGSTANENGTGIGAGRFDVYEGNYDCVVSGNTIIGFQSGINATNTKLEVSKNKVTDCKHGIQLGFLTHSEIFDNVVESSVQDSDGILSSAASQYLNEVRIYDNEISVTRAPMIFVNQNKFNQDYNFYIENNNLISGGPNIESTYGVKLNNNIFNGRFRIENVVRADITNNEINASSDGIRIDNGCKDVNIFDNSIKASNRCIWYNGSDLVNIVERNNSCN